MPPKGFRRKNRILQPILNNPFHNLQIGRRTGKPLNIKARKDSMGFDRVDDYFRDEDLDSGDENSNPKEMETKHKDSNISYKEMQVQSTTSKQAAPTSAAALHNLEAETSQECQETANCDKNSSVAHVGPQEGSTPAVMQEFENIEGTAVRNNSVTEPTPFYRGTKKRLQFDFDTSLTNTDVISQDSLKKSRFSKKNDSTRRSPDGESNEEIDVVKFSDNEGEDVKNDSVNDNVSAMVSANPDVSEDSDCDGSDHEENIFCDVSGMKSPSKPNKAENFLKKRRESENGKDANITGNVTCNQTQTVDITSFADDNTFLTIGKINHSPKVNEVISASPSSSSGDFVIDDGRFIEEATRYKCMSPEFGQSLKVSAIKPELSGKNTRQQRMRNRQRSGAFVKPKGRKVSLSANKNVVDDDECDHVSDGEEYEKHVSFSGSNPTMGEDIQESLVTLESGEQKTDNNNGKSSLAILEKVNEIENLQKPLEFPEIVEKKSRKQNQSNKRKKENKSSVKKSEDKCEINLDALNSIKNSQNSPDKNQENEVFDLGKEETLGKTEIPTDKTKDETGVDTVNVDKNISQKESISKKSNRKRRKKITSVCYRPYSSRNKKQKKNLQDVLKEDKSGVCSRTKENCTEEKLEKNVSEDEALEGSCSTEKANACAAQSMTEKGTQRKRTSDNSSAVNESPSMPRKGRKTSRKEKMGDQETEQETKTVGHSSYCESDSPSPPLANEETDVSVKENNTPFTSISCTVATVKKSILKSGKTRIRKTADGTHSDGSLVDENANDKVVNKRLSSVSFVPLPTIMKVSEDDDQSLTAEKEERASYGRLSFISTNLSCSSAERAFPPEVNADDTGIKVSTESSGLRRSRRHRVPTLKFWKNERIDYDGRRKSGLTFRGIIRNPTPKPKVRKKPKAKAKKKTAVEDSEDDMVDPEGLPEGLMGEFNPCAEVINPDTQEQVALDLFHIPEMLNFINVSRKPATASDPLIIDKFMQHNQFSVGQFVLRGGAEKGKQHVRQDTMIFYVVKGKLLVTVHETTAVLKTGSTFFVPQGNVYRVKNLKKSDATVLFVQVKGYVNSMPT